MREEQSRRLSESNINVTHLIVNINRGTMNLKTRNKTVPIDFGVIYPSTFVKNNDGDNNNSNNA